MNVSIFKTFQILKCISDWIVIAIADGKITSKEAIALAVKFAEILDIRIEIEESSQVPDMGIGEVTEYNGRTSPTQSENVPITKPEED